MLESKWYCDVYVQVHGVFTSSVAAKRIKTHFQPLDMSPRETVAVAHFLLRNKMDHAKAKKEGVKRLAKPNAKKTKVTLEEVWMHVTPDTGECLSLTRCLNVSVSV